MSTPLRRRLIILTAVAIIPLALLAGAGLYVMTRQQDEQSRRVGIELAVSIANAVSTELRGSITILQTLATAPSLDRNDVTAFRDRATRIIGVQHSWAALILTAPDGTPTLDTRVAAGAPPLPIIDIASMQEVVRTGAPVVGNLVKHQDQWLFPVRAPVMRGGQLQHIITALIRPSAIVDVINGQHVPDDWVISIVDAQGLRIARSRAHDENLGGRLSETAQAMLAGSGDEGTGITTSLEGDQIFTPFSSVRPFGWKAVLGIPTAAMQAATMRFALMLGGGVLLSILLGTLSAGWVAQRITGPIEHLRDAAAALGRRELPQLPSSDLAEVHAVGDALTKAAGEMVRYEAERNELLENERAAREAAQRADHAKDEFLAVLSHELRTPLNAVFGWARLLQSKQLPQEHVNRAMDAIVRNADAQVRLIDDLLDLSRIGSGKMQLSMERVELKEVRQGALDAIRPSADEKGIRLVVEVDDDASVIIGDPPRLQQIVWNLLVNAVKFTDRGGEIRLRQQAVDGHVEITVSDTGLGLAPDLLPHVFDRFRQADSSSTRSYRGLGLGLALVKDLVQMHGGTVSAASAGAGQGSTFTVRLPSTPQLPAPAAASPMPAQLSEEMLRKIVRLDGVRVIVTDDNPDALMLAATILGTAGAVVRTCSAAAAAVKLVAELRPDVLVSDLEMPDQDGYALIAAVRQLPPARGGATPAIALSAYGRPQDRSRALAAGFNMHVPKPVDPGELTAIVASLAGRAVAPQPSTDHGKMPSSM